jgi:hypothetical protein
MPCTDSAARGVPSELHDDHEPRIAADGAHPITAAVCEHLLGDCFAAPVERLRAAEPSR